MAKNLVEFPVGYGEDTILIEVVEPVQGALQRVALNPTKQLYQATQSFSQAIAKAVKPAATALIKEMRELPDPPDEVEAKFGLMMSMEVGAVITAGSEANFEVTLKWSKK